MKACMNIDTKALTRDIKSIKVRSASIDSDVQSAAMRAVQVANKVTGTGNLYFVNALYKALGKGHRHVALTSWFLEFGGLKANTAATKDDTPFIHDDNKVMDLEQGAAMPWYDLKQSAKPDQVFDVLALAMALVKKTPKEGQESAHMALRDRLVNLVAEYKAEVEATAEEGVEAEGEKA